MTTRTHSSATSSTNNPNAEKNERDSHIDDLRTQVLDYRATTINRWLAVMAIFLTVFAIMVAIGGFLAFDRFREIEREASENLKETQQLIRKYNDQLRSIDAEIATTDPTTVENFTASVRADLGAGVLHRAILDALHLQEEEKIDEAIEKWRSVANLSESMDAELSSRSWYSVGYLYEHSDRAEEAILAYEQAITLNPNYAHAFKHLGIVKVHLDRYEEAIDDYDRAISLRPRYYEAYSYRGHAKHYLYKFEEAIKDYNIAIRLKPDYARAYTYRAHTMDHLSRYEEAIADYDIAIRLDPTSAESYSGRGETRIHMELYEEAIVDLDVAIHLKPDYWWALFHRADANAQLGRYVETVRDFDEVIRLKPGHIGAYIRRGEAYAELGELSQAIVDYDTAIALRPTYALAYLKRGSAALALGLKDKARDDLEKARKLALAANNETMAKEAEEALRSLD